MLRAWAKLIWYHLHEIIIVLALVMLALIYFPWDAWSYDSAVTNPDGSTTYTITASTSDGYIVSDGATWSYVRTTGEAANDSDQSQYGVIGGFATGSPLSYYVRRVWLPFDTTGISGTISAATITVTSKGLDGGTDGVTVFVQGSAALPLSIGDFTEYGSTEIAARSPWYVDGDCKWDLQEAVSSAFNASGLAALQSALGGTFQVALLEKNDFENDEPLVDIQEDAGLYFADSSTAGYRPKLEITIAAPISDLFDGSTVGAQWTKYTANGINSVSGGYLHQEIADSTPGYVSIYRTSGADIPIDVRAFLSMSVPLEDSQQAWFAVFDASPDYAIIKIKNDSGTVTIFRSDMISFVLSDGDAVTLPSSTKTVYFRITVSALGAAACYYKTDACASWTLLDEPDTPMTAAGAVKPLLWGQQGGSAPAVDFRWNWIVENSEYADYPTCTPTAVAGPIIWE